MRAADATSGLNQSQESGIVVLNFQILFGHKRYESRDLRESLLYIYIPLILTKRLQLRESSTCAT